VRHGTILGGLALILSACTVGPNYSGPSGVLADGSINARVLASPKEVVAVNSPMPDLWWQLYKDPTLNSLVERALASNVDLRSAEANIRGAAAIVQRAKAARDPVTSLSGGVAYAQDGIPTPSSSQFVYAVAGSVAYPVDLFGGLRRGIEAAQYEAEAAVAARDEIRVVVAAGITRSYTAACSANRSYAAGVEVLNTQKHTLTTTERLFIGGRATQFDVTRARTMVDQTAASLPAFIAARDTALLQLGALLGGVPQNYPRQLADCASPPSLEQAFPMGDGAALLRRRPDLRAAERSLAATTATIGVSVAKLYPQITLGGSASSSAPFSLAASEASLAFSIGPLITWTFPNQQVIRAEIAQANASSEQAAARLDAAIIEALRQTETALSVYVRQIDSVSALEHARADAHEANEQAHRLYSYGRTDFINVLTAESALASAEVLLSVSNRASHLP
jgi:NodT family efflux transporter outer membrane factor (OMF) lipoprotein